MLPNLDRREERLAVTVAVLALVLFGVLFLCGAIAVG